MNKYIVINKLNNEHITQLIELFKQTWWANERTKDEINLMLKTSISFGLIQKETENLIGYARVLTDEIKYAFIFDLIVSESLQGKGLGKFLMQTIMAYPKFQNVKNFDLTCASDKITFYEKFGFNKDYGEKSQPMRLRLA